MSISPIQSYVNKQGGFTVQSVEVIEAAGAPPATLKRPVGVLYYDTTSQSYYASGNAGVWIALGGSSVAISNVLGTANQVTSTVAGGVATLSLPAALQAPGSVTAATGLTATSGGVTASAGNIVATLGNITASAGNIAATLGSLSAGTTVTAGTDLVSTAGNVLINGSAKQLRVKGGAVTDFIGDTTLVAGTVTIANTNIAAGDQVYVTRYDINGSTALGIFEATISAGASFTINSRKPADATIEANDVSKVKYFIVRAI